MKKAKTRTKRLCHPVCQQLLMEDSTWINFEDIILNTPLTQNNNHVQLIRNEKLIHVDDETYAYYLKFWNTGYKTKSHRWNL